MVSGDQVGGTGWGEQPASGEDRSWALLSYLLPPFVPAFLMVTGRAARPFLRAHAAQGLTLGIIQLALLALGSFLGCLAFVPSALLAIGQIYWGLQAYGGHQVTIPVVSGLARQ